MTATILSINISSKKGVKKSPIRSAKLIASAGIEGDAHAGSVRQVSLLAIESIRKMSADIPPGSFAENITTEGVNLLALPIGTRLKLGSNAEIEITEHGKVCHDRCDIYKTHGRCVMPEEGIFAKVVNAGIISAGDIINVTAK